MKASSAADEVHRCARFREGTRSRADTVVHDRLPVGARSAGDGGDGAAGPGAGRGLRRRAARPRRRATSTTSGPGSRIPASEHGGAGRPRRPARSLRGGGGRCRGDGRPPLHGVRGWRRAVHLGPRRDGRPRAQPLHDPFELRTGPGGAGGVDPALVVPPVRAAGHRRRCHHHRGVAGHSRGHGGGPARPARRRLRIGHRLRDGAHPPLPGQGGPGWRDCRPAPSARSRQLQTCVWIPTPRRR